MFQKHLVYSTEYRNLKKSQAYATKAESEFEKQKTITFWSFKKNASYASSPSPTCRMIFNMPIQSTSTKSTNVLYGMAFFSPFFHHLGPWLIKTYEPRNPCSILRPCVHRYFLVWKSEAQRYSYQQGLVGFCGDFHPETSSHTPLETTSHIIDLRVNILYFKISIKTTIPISLIKTWCWMVDGFFSKKTPRL